MNLPIWQIHGQIIECLTARNRLVLVAPTGSGKTTQVPQMLLDAGLCPGLIVVLQPRRVAARSVAARVASERGGPLGAEVGYQIRLEDRTSLGTRICFVTEGILLRWLQDDRGLPGISCILFDEFHERNLFSDVGLGLVKRLQETTRPDLKIVVMSATLAAEPVAQYLGGCAILVSEGKAFPVVVTYNDLLDERPISEQAADKVAEIIHSGQGGDILVFMPGVGEINATLSACHSAGLKEKLALIPLHGELNPMEQDAAFAPNPLRKIVVATNVAETSVTIDGIIHVVDSGQARVARYDSARGIGTLFIEPVSRAAAEQRAGRAGRTAPGFCHRLWTEGGHLNRPERNTPEIQRSDLTEVVLLLHSLGIVDAVKFDWLDRPDGPAVARAEKLLRTLGALYSSNEIAQGQGGSDITAIGRQMLRLPMHPRYSRMVVEAMRHDCVPAAALCAALVSGRDLLMRLGRDDKHIAEARELFEASADSDFYTLMRAFQFARNHNFQVEKCRCYGVHAQIARQVEEVHQQILRAARPGVRVDDVGAEASAKGGEGDPLLRCLTAGFIDQLCLRRNMGTLECDLTEGRTATLVRESVVQNSSLFVAASLREVAGRNGNLTLLGLATATRREWIEEMFPSQITRAIQHLFDRTHKRVSAVKLTRFQDLVLHFEHQPETDPAAAGRCLAEASAKEYFELPLFDHEIKQILARINLAATAMPELEIPLPNESFIQDVLARAFTGFTLVKEAQAVKLKEFFLEKIGRDRWEWIAELAPSTVTLIGDRKVKILYPLEQPDPDGKTNSPEIQIKLHDIFGLKEHPCVCENRVPLKIWLCSPDGKRIEPTTDWPIWRSGSYPKIRARLQQKSPSLTWP